MLFVNLNLLSESDAEMKIGVLNPQTMLFTNESRDANDLIPSPVLEDPVPTTVLLAYIVFREYCPIPWPLIPVNTLLCINPLSTLKALAAENPVNLLKRTTQFVA